MKKILIIEDDQIVANIYRNKFAVEGYDVATAPDGQAGMESLRNFRPDAVVLDLMLPKVSGVDLMKKIRAEPDFEKIPIIVFSNTYLSNTVQDAWKAGATKCLSKANCSPKQLIEVVRSTLSKNGSTAPATQESASAAKPQDDGLKNFLAGLPTIVSGLRTLLQATIKAPDESTRLDSLNEAYRRVHSLTANAALAGDVYIARLADAFEALLLELYLKPSNINPSTLRTVASAIDLLGRLSERVPGVSRKELPARNILVVDDEPISRRAVTAALDKASLKSVSLEDPQLALNIVGQTKFELIILDVNMPNMNGFELCAKIRSLPGYDKTPVVFVTGLTDFESRANSTISGGNDLIGKPFLFVELAVKALIYILRPQVSAVK